jgi:2-dehydropantoate 2-reductase
MTTVAVIGPGAIGGTVAVRLIESRRHVVIICARSPIAELIVEASQGVSTVVPTTLTSPDEAAPVDWVCIATKAHDSAGAANWLRALVGPATRVAVLQNGVESVARFAPYIPVAQLVPVVVDMPVERIAPGRFRQRRDGRLTVAAGDDGRSFTDLFAGTSITVTTTQDFRTEAWRKLALNCAGAVSALVLKPAAIVWNNAVADIMRALVRECVAVGQMEGAVIDEALVEEVIDNYRRGPADAINSMHADRIAGRPLEVDARNGAVVRFGRKHGIPTPVNQMMVTLLEIATQRAHDP